MLFLIKIKRFVFKNYFKFSPCKPTAGLPKMSLPMYSLFPNIIKNFCQVLQISQLLFGRELRPVTSGEMAKKTRDLSGALRSVFCFACYLF